MIPDLTWPEVVGFISAVAIGAGTIYKIIKDVWHPIAPTQSSEKSEALEKQIVILAERIEGQQRWIKELSDKQDQMIKLLIEGLSKV